MSDQRMHFRGRYRGIFKISHSGQTHAAVFHQLSLSDLQISDLKAIPRRDVLLEKTGDYLYLASVKPASRFGIAGINLLIWKDPQTAFSERIDEVVLQHDAKRSAPFSPVRTLHGVRLANNDLLLEGIVYFTVLNEPTTFPPQQANVSSVANESDIIIPQERAAHSEPVFKSKPSPEPLPHFSKTLGQNRGCVPLFRRMFSMMLLVFLLMKFFLFLVGWISRKADVKQQEVRREGNAGMNKGRLDPDQDTLAPMPWNYLYDHEVKWKDFSLRSYLARYTTSSKAFDASNRNHLSWRNVPVTDELLYFHDLYNDLSVFDKPKLDSLINYFETRRRVANLNPLATAEMVVTFIQEIPYVLVHDGSCSEALRYGGFIADYHLQRKECLSNVVAGVQSPYEFVHTMKGDCDTRTLLAYTLLDRLKISCSVWVSKAYGHSVLGLGVPAGSPNYKVVSGRRHYATEMTVKGFRAGMVAPEHRNMNNWNVVLHNQ